MRLLTGLLMIFLLTLVARACPSDVEAAAVGSAGAKYVWNQVAEKASFPEGYNYPVFVLGNWMVAMNNGAWLSKDGEKWTKTDLPASGLNSGYQRYLKFKGAIYALGTMQGNYSDMKLSSRIARTRDFNSWEILAERSNLPRRVFYGSIVFKDKIWLFGGYDGKRYYNDVWNSADGVAWEKVAGQAPWSSRLVSAAVVFKNRIWFFGGGVIDGEKNPDPNSGREVWSSPDGKTWTQVTSAMADVPVYIGPYSAAVFDGRIWLAGVNRSGEFQSGILYSDDGAEWHEMNAPWSARGGVAVWGLDNKLFLTGGKSSHVENGEIKFVYSNDVWAMSIKTE